VGRLSEEARRHEVLVEAGLALVSELSLPIVLQKIVDLACDVADAKYGAVGVVGANGRISEFITHGITQEERDRIGPLPEGHGLLGVLIEKATPLRLRNIRDHMSSSGFPPNHPPMTSFLGVPIAIRGRVFGNLYLTEKKGSEEFTESDEDAVLQLAAQAAVAIENARLYAEAQMSHRRITAVNDVMQAILQGRDARELLPLIANHARELVDAKIATVVTPDEDDPKRLIVRVADGDHAEALGGLVFPSSNSVSGEVMRSNETLVLADALSDRRTHQPFVKLGDIGPAIFAPLAVKDRAFGTLAVGNHPGDRLFSSEDVGLVQTFAAQASVALEQARIQGELKRFALVEDRERIAKELHDDVIQSLFAEGMALQSSLAVVGNPEAMETRITQAVEHIDRVIRDLRNYIFALTPGAAADHALERSLKDVAREFAAASNTDIEVVADPTAAARLSGKTADVLQAAREAISNAVRHSGGDTVRVSLACTTDTAVLEVADNGKGFSPLEAAGKGNGLKNLRSRAESMGGELDIESAPGQGTWVRVRIPL
jgi:signal transduction histidine kinase